MRPAIVVLLGAACGGETRPAAPAAPVAALTATPAPGVTRVHGAQVVVDAVPPGPCTAGSPCDVRLEVHATGGYKLNVEYPTKFVPREGTPLTYPTPPKLAAAGERGALPVRFVAATPGPAQVHGELKVGVCDDERCEIEAVPIAIDVAVR